MEKITAYKSLSGKIFTEYEDCVRADERYIQDRRRAYEIKLIKDTLIQFVIKKCEGEDHHGYTSDRMVSQLHALFTEKELFLELLQKLCNFDEIIVSDGEMV